MQAGPLTSKIDAAQVPLERLANNATLSEAEKVASASRHFEAILLRQFLNEAYKPIFHQKKETSGAVSDIYQDMLVNNLADEISQSGKFGLAKFFQTQLQQPNAKSTATAAGLRARAWEQLQTPDGKNKTTAQAGVPKNESRTGKID